MFMTSSFTGHAHMTLPTRLHRLPSERGQHRGLRVVCSCGSGIKRVAQHLAPAALGAALMLNTFDTPAQAITSPVYDGAKIVAAGKELELAQQLSDFERDVWPVDKDTVVLKFDPSSPNIMSFPYIGDNVLAKLRRPFWQELQSRYGNLFYVREQGEQSAISESLGALVGCLGKPDGCRVVPGLPDDQYYFTLALSMAGGLVFGFASKLEAQGIVQRKWIWLLIFSPLWGMLFVNFGIGPIVARTDSILPLLGNAAGFTAAAAFVAYSPQFTRKLFRPDDA